MFYDIVNINSEKVKRFQLVQYRNQIHQIVPRFDDRRLFATWRSEMNWKITIKFFI